MVAYAGDRDASDTVILKECFACLLGMTKAAAADQALAGTPHLHTNFTIQQLIETKVRLLCNSYCSGMGHLGHLPCSISIQRILIE